MMTTDKQVSTNRVLSLDALRGFDMFLLEGFAWIFLALPKLADNNVTNWWANQFRHPKWEGFTIYDEIFPLFIFIVGVSMSFSFPKRLKQEGGKKKLYKHVLIRTLTLAILGAVLYLQPGGGSPNWGYYSVLYRISFGYFFAAIIMMNTSIRNQVYWAFGILIGFWIVMRFTPVPGYGIGNFSKEGNLSTYIGNHVATYISPKMKYVINPFLVTSISNTLLGVFAGYWLQSDKDGIKKTMGLLLAGVALIILGFIVNLDFPINARLASTSFTLLSCGISAVLLGLFYWVIDVKGYVKWAFFFKVVGVNAITIYVASWLVRFRELSKVFVGNIDFGNANELAFAITFAVIQWLFLYYLYKQKIFFKI